VQYHGYKGLLEQDLGLCGIEGIVLGRARGPHFVPESRSLAAGVGAILGADRPHLVLEVLRAGEPDRAMGFLMALDESREALPARHFSRCQMRTGTEFRKLDGEFDPQAVILDLTGISLLKVAILRSCCSGRGIGLGAIYMVARA